jgi:hypothetical protein
MSRLLLVALSALIADVGALDCRQGQPSEARCPAAPYIAVVDDSHEPKLPDVIRIEPDESTDPMPKAFISPAPAPAAPTATMCATAAGNCALRAPASIGATCSCQSKAARVFGTAQ